MATGTIKTLNREQITVTKGSTINSIDISAYRYGNVVTVSGYALLNAGTYTAQTPIFTVSKHPDYYVYSNDNTGNAVRLDPNGTFHFQGSQTLSAQAYRFYNFSYIIA